MPELHPGQRAVRDSDTRFRVLACGRRWGKTRLGAALCLETGLRGGASWWVGPTYPVASIGWRLVRWLAGQVPATGKSEVERRVDFPSGGWVQVKSAHDPDSLRGEGLDFVVLDECAFIPERAWSEGLRPALADRQGHALFISTPAGRNWFWRLWQQAQAEDDDWAGWRFPTADNPYVPPEEIEAARRNLPERIFLQEFMAEFIDDAGGVFRHVMDQATAAEADYQQGLRYVFGVDWGKHQDWTVIAILNDRGQMVALDRFNRIDYVVQVGRLKALAEHYRPIQIVAEANAMGEPLIEQLQRDGLPVLPFTTTAASKTVAIDSLALAFEQGAIQIIPDPVLVGELQAYQAERLPSGMLRYGAPAGMHDDCVMALALAWQGVNVPVYGPPGTVSYVR